jgi:hypothetical protein
MPPAARETGSAVEPAHENSAEPAHEGSADDHPAHAGSAETKPKQAAPRGPTKAEPKPHKTDPKAGAHPAEPPAVPPTAPPARPPDDDVEGDEDVRQKLKEAATALEHHDYEAAERLASAVIHSPASPRQHASARLIHGTVQCVLRNDQEAAGIDLRSLERFRVLRGKLLSVCRSRGVLTGP